MTKEGVYWFYFDKDQLKKLIAIFGTTNKDELKQKIESKIFDEKPTENLNTITQRKKNLKLDLENWNALKLMNFKQEQIVNLLTEKITLESLVYPELPKDKPQFDDFFNCSFCGHKHCSTGSHACLASICNCGIRG